LSKYLSPQLYDSIFSGEKQAKIESEKKFLSIFFSDIVSFTSISDDMNSKSLTDMLNTYLSKMSDIALSFGGTIDKYIGDAIMIFFGDPVSKGYRDDAINCVRMAIAMQKKMKEMSFEFTSKYKLTIP
jgi:class 3 adenylate cyclase